jgi:hypothetical protein
MMTFTTRLLEGLDDRMPRRHQVIAAVLITFIALAAIAGSRPAPGPTLVVQPPIILIATPTLPPARGLAKEAAPLAVLVAPTVAPTETSAPPPVEQPAVAFVASHAPTPQPPATSTPAPPPVATIPVVVYTWKSDGTLLSTYQCKPYGDWRDTDPVYVHPECVPQR